MPTATAYFDYAVTNLGPLTSTFTAPSSCSTAATGFYYIGDPKDPQRLQYGPSDCATPTHGDCLPAGDAIDQRQVDAYSQTKIGAAQYFSPGIHCPSGWTTAGSILGADGSATASSASGIFTADGFPFPSNEDSKNDEYGFPLPLINVYKDIINSSETLAWCCPDGYQAGIYGECSSVVKPASEYKPTEYCEKLWRFTDYADVTTFDGTTWDPYLESLRGGAGATAVVSGTIPSASREGLSVITYAPAIALVHQSDDLKQGGDSTTASGDESATGDPDSAAATTRPGLASTSLIPVAAVAVGVLAGAGMLLPW